MTITHPREARTATTAVFRTPALLRMTGPAFVAAVAYVDPGNVATNITAGARHGYLLLWVLAGANIMAMLVQYLSAKLTIATGATLPEICARRLRRPARLAMWAQAETVAIATDLAEVVGGAVALHLLFGTPLVAGGLITGAVSWVMLVVQSRRGQRRFEAVVIALLAVILVGFVFTAFDGGVSLDGLVSGLVPGLSGTDSLFLSCGILGATVMPHAIYLHGALLRDRHGEPRGRGRELLRATRLDVLTAMGLAGMVNAAILAIGAAALSPAVGASLEGAYRGLAAGLGQVPAAFFALALLASGLAATSVGTYAGTVIAEGFLGRWSSLSMRRLATLVPAMAVLAAGAEPGRVLVISQVVLSFGIPFALWPLVMFTHRRDLMGRPVNRPVTTVCAAACASAVTVLNCALVWYETAG